MKSETEIPVVFEDDDLYVVDKPVGISVHNTDLKLGDETNLLVLLTRILKHRGETARLFPVHRLDKETSGLQIFARNESAARTYATEFESRDVLKIYSGLLRGRLTEGDTSNTTEVAWRWPLTDKAEGRNNPAGLSASRIPCETKVHVIAQSKYFTRCEFNLVTGRQHQIRKHAAIAKHSLVGDSRYGDATYNRRMADMYKTSRMFLHCGRVEIRGLRLESPTPECFDLLLPTPKS